MRRATWFRILLKLSLSLEQSLRLFPMGEIEMKLLGKTIQEKFSICPLTIWIHCKNRLINDTNRIAIEHRLKTFFSSKPLTQAEKLVYTSQIQIVPLFDLQPDHQPDNERRVRNLCEKKKKCYGHNLKPSANTTIKHLTKKI